MARKKKTDWKLPFYGQRILLKGYKNVSKQDSHIFFNLIFCKNLILLMINVMCFQSH